MALRTLSRKSLAGLTRNGRGGLGFGLVPVRGLKTFTLPDLPYDYGALEPSISREIMEIHHLKHHNTYVDNFNKALDNLEQAMDTGDSSTVVKLQSALKFNGGGLEGGGEPPKGSLGWEVDNQFGSLQSLKQKMMVEGSALQGSGWVWLALDKDQKKLSVECTANQDPLIVKGANYVPLLGIDVWEHAYYLQYKNVRPDYLKYIWEVVNWKYASEVYEKEYP
ncbi:putative superoxide dismutase [Rosa chinensis]|uniref:Superoxide dismutase n=1 Tax=Rosa chinensis TaxID=74649 RepID=A0A2P6QKR6_ROSCH|nr:putative superoxide dismutase [Rosa chinensis]